MGKGAESRYVDLDAYCRVSPPHNLEYKIFPPAGKLSPIITEWKENAAGYIRAH
jgi:hypothetical protein